MNLNEALEKILNHYNSENNTNNHFEITLDNIHMLEIDSYKIKVKELTWKEGLHIDSMAIKNNKNDLYFSSEVEKRNIVSKAIIEIYDADNNKLDFKFEDLEHSFVEKVWKKYQDYLHLNTEEVHFIYNASKKYFDPNDSSIFALHPLILEVDYMTKGIVTLSRTEFEKLSIREFETIQLILSAKNEVNLPSNSN
jgi:hypothetical protein